MIDPEVKEPSQQQLTCSVCAIADDRVYTVMLHGLPYDAMHPDCAQSIFGAPAPAPSQVKARTGWQKFVAEEPPVDAHFHPRRDSDSRYSLRSSSSIRRPQAAAAGMIDASALQLLIGQAKHAEDSVGPLRALRYSGIRTMRQANGTEYPMFAVSISIPDEGTPRERDILFARTPELAKFVAMLVNLGDDAIPVLLAALQSVSSSGA